MLDLRCLFGFHDHDYFTMTRLDGGTEHHRCCLRCERSELLSVKLSNESRAMFATVRDDILGARKSLSAIVTDADLALLNSDAEQAQAKQAQGRTNLLALFGVTTPTGLDEG